MRLDRASVVLRFIGAGGVGVLLYYILLPLLTEVFGVWYMMSAFIASIANGTSNFVLHKLWTFKNRDQGRTSVQLVQYGLLFTSNLVLLYLSTKWLGIWYMHAQPVITVLISIASFFFTRIIFAPTTPPPQA